MPATSKKVPTEASALATWLSFASEVGSRIRRGEDWGFVLLLPQSQVESAPACTVFLNVPEPWVESLSRSHIAQQFRSAD